MKPIRIGKLIIQKKAVFLIAFCLLLNGATLGAMAASNQSSESGFNVIVLLVLILLPYLVFYKSISKHIKEVN